MPKSNKKAMDKWYQEHKNEVFELLEKFYIDMIQHYGFGIFTSDTCFPKDIIFEEDTEYITLKCGNCGKTWSIKRKEIEYESNNSN